MLGAGSIIGVGFARGFLRVALLVDFAVSGDETKGGATVVGTEDGRSRLLW